LIQPWNPKIPESLALKLVPLMLFFRFSFP